MRSSNMRTRGRRVSAALAILALAGAALCAQAFVPSQENKATDNRSASTSFVGVWHAEASNGLRVATLTVVPAAGGGVAGAFLGYVYDRPIDPSKPIEGDPPKVTTRSGSAFISPALNAGVLAFSMQLRLTAPPPGAPEFFDIRGEMRVTGDGTGELKLSSPRKPEPMTLKLTRE